MSISFIQSTAEPLFRKYNVQKAAVFGSHAAGAASPSSDIDLLLELPHGTTLFSLAQIKSDLEETLHSKVDIVTYNSIHPRLKDRILNEQQVIYEKR